MTIFITPPQPASAPIDEQAMRQQHYTNGAAPPMPTSILNGQIVISSKVALTVVSALTAAIIGGGWFLSPAKDRDLQDTRKEVAAITAAVGAMAEKVDKLIEQTHEVRIDVARMQSSGSPAPAPPQYRAKSAKAMPRATAEKPASLFGGF